MLSCRGAVPPLLAALALVVLPPAAAAQAARSGSGSLSARAFVSPRLRPAPAAEDRGARGAWTGLAPGWQGRANAAEGPGITWKLGAHPTLDDLERAARAFLPRVERLLGAEASSLVLNRQRSGPVGSHLWNVDFDVVRDGLPVEGARVVFRVSHGRLIQVGGENLPSPEVPKARISREEALSLLAGQVQGFSSLDAFLDGGSLHRLPAALVWQFSFQRKGEPGTWRGRVDAATGEVLELRDTDIYARVTGGVGDAVLPMPFARLPSGAVTDSSGWFDAEPGAFSDLTGPYVRVRDSCGTVSQPSDWSGDIAFGSSGSDCSTPGHGGPGNTRAARAQFFHVNRAREAARAWLPDNEWLGRRLTVNVNLNRTCNAYWDGSTINFFRSGGGCGNTGEIAAVALHEYGHGLDANDGNGLSPDLGTAEAYGDFLAALATRDSCIGSGFRPAHCGGYGDPCTDCTGVRDLDWAKRASGVPHTVDNFTRLRCPASSAYAGPCGREGHCESYVASEALWDFAEREASWAVAERLWYLSRSSATAAFSCDTGGEAWTSDGCGIGSLWKTMRAADDDDGDLSNGTPHSCRLFAAFDRHGIACADDPGADVCFSACSPPEAPEISLVPGERQVQVSWTADPETVFDVYRAEGGCGAPLRKVADDLAAPLYMDTVVVPGTAYGYQVVAHPVGSEACASPPGACAEAVPEAPPCPPPAAPAELAATADGLSRADLSWTPSPGSLGTNVYRSGRLVATVPAPGSSWSDAGLAGGTSYEYRVRAFTLCESAPSAPAAVTTDPCSPAILFQDGFESGSGLGGWTAKTVGFNGSVEDWRGMQVCPSRGGGRVLRFGGPGCGDSYGDHQFAYAQPGGESGLKVPADSAGARLSFWHRRDLETGFDGAVLLLSVDGGPHVPVPASALSGAVYDGTIAPICAPASAPGLPVFTGATDGFEESVVDLDAACDLATGETGGCAGHTLYLGFAGISDCSAGGSGWSIDDVAVATCAALPVPLDFHTVAPCRLLDTRSPSGPTGGQPLAAGSTAGLALGGACGVPATARSLSVNVTVPDPLAGGIVTLSAADRAGAGSFPFDAGRTRAVHTLLRLPVDGSGEVRVQTGPATHLVLDVTGYFQESGK